MNRMTEYIYSLADDVLDNIIMEDVFISESRGILFVTSRDEDGPYILDLEPYEHVNYADGIVEEAYEISSQEVTDRFKSFCVERLVERYQDYLRNQLKLSDAIA